MVARISDAALPVELADAALPDAEALEDDPVSSALLEVAEEDPNGDVSSGIVFLSSGLPEVTVLSAVLVAEDGALVAAAAPPVVVLK